MFHVRTKKLTTLRKCLLSMISVLEITRSGCFSQYVDFGFILYAKFRLFSDCYSQAMIALLDA